MAKKKRKYLIKLNNRVRNLFDGLSFDEGIATLEENRLVEICMLLELDLVELSSEEMIRGLRRFWSDGDHRDREDVVRYLRPLISPKERASAKPVDRVEKIVELLSTIPHTPSEQIELLESFIDTKRAKITIEKISSKLRYIRIKKRISSLEDTLDVSFNSLGEMSFYESYKFGMEEVDFSKRLLTSSDSIKLDNLWDRDDKSIESLLWIEKEMMVSTKQEEIDRWLSLLNEKEHKWLTQEQIISHIKSMPPEADIYHIPLSTPLLEEIVETIDSSYMLFESSEHYIVEAPQRFNLFGVDIPYIITVSYTKNLIYSNIWSGDTLPIADDLLSLDSLLVEHFITAIDDIYSELVELSEGLEIPQEKIESYIVQFVSPQIESSQTLKLKEKSRRRILYHFGEYLKPLRARQMREELLAKSIRDFKNLFPLARSLNRKIIFHVGPTNSGKTYSAIKRLKSATTGYYLAPLRLLALEGYENLQREGLSISLITGEEEIIDEESTHISSTIEMLNSSVEVDMCVIDEIQMIDDRDRGWAWANALIGVPSKVVILTGSSNALKAVEALCEYLQEPLEIVEFERKNPLEILSKPISIEKIEKGTAVVAFSRKEVLSLKQQISKRDTVSVIYGNLSPEVRRDEARRFRDGQSSILVATDAIAMGLNLPIKTLLFAKDNKFDGIRRRELTPSEVLQISGRAGRYGIEEHGFVGAMDTNTLKTITKQFHKPLPDIELPFSVMASLEHVMLIGEILESDNIMEILNFFADNMEFDGPFIAANIDSMLEIASIVDEYELDLKTRYFLSCAPASISSPYIESVFHRYIRNIEKNSLVLYLPPRDLPAFAQTNDMLLNAEDRVREISLYLWLSFKFPELFRDTQKATDARVRLNKFIENSLQKGHFVKKCHRCNRVLDFSYRFSICDGCYRRGRRR
jgi:ATP-dependent RNA helicase SUPV3L1/SUV3